MQDVLFHSLDMSWVKTAGISAQNESLASDFNSFLSRQKKLTATAATHFGSTMPVGSVLIPARVKSAKKFAVVLVTAPDLPAARRLVRAALSARLIACANLIPKIESHYWWCSKMESGREVLLVLKTTKSMLPALEKLILARHPYETPEFLVLPPAAGSEKYLGWITGNCRRKWVEPARSHRKFKP